MLPFVVSSGPSSSMFPSMDNFLDENNHDQIVPSLSSPGQISPRSPTDYLPERYSRKVFVGGLPPDIDEGERYCMSSENPRILNL